MWNILRQLSQRVVSVTANINLNATQLPPSWSSHFYSIQQKPLSTLSTNISPLLTRTSNLISQCPFPSSSPSPMFGGLMIVPSRGMKIKGKVKRRCKDCYLIWESGVLHNRCKTHPRHTQKQKEKYWANTRILTHATMGSKRPW